MLTATNISKSFSGVKALDQVSLALPAGQVTAIIGENGAGKSTLMKILSGVYTEYEGQVMLGKEPCRFRNTRDAPPAATSSATACAAGLPNSTSSILENTMRPDCSMLSFLRWLAASRLLA